MKTELVNWERRAEGLRVEGSEFRVCWFVVSVVCFRVCGAGVGFELV